ncbi:hypothetical protein JCM8547_008574 [Rhodosporidiobolus lusitaniae]
MRAIRPLRYGGGARPTLPKRFPGHTVSPGYATFAPSHPPLARPPTLHPSLLLFHLSGITAASCLIPAIGARHVSSQAVEPVEQEPSSSPVPPVDFDYIIQQPYPPRYQRLRLATHLRKQIATSPADAAFTLRQLHLVNQVPQIHLPDQSVPHPPSQDLSNLLPERWIWRQPAAAAFHSILRIVLDTSSPHHARLSEAFLPIALTIAQHSLRWDTLVWAAVLRGQKQMTSIEWERLVAAERDRTADELAMGPPVAHTRLKKRPRPRTSDPKLEEWEKAYERLAQAAWRGQDLPREMKPPSQRTAKKRKEQEEQKMSQHAEPELPPLPSHLHPSVSLRTRSLDHLVLHLAQQSASKPSLVTPALSLSLSLSHLRRPRSFRSLVVSFYLALHHFRSDMAAVFWVDMLEAAARTPSSTALRHLSSRLHQLASVLRPEQNGFEAVPSRTALAAVATLARALDERWATRAVAEQLKPVLGELIRLLATFPPAPFANDFLAGSSRRAYAKRQAKVATMVREVLRRVVEDVAHRGVFLGPVRAVVDPHRPDLSSASSLSLSVHDYNTLISYSLLKLQSPELAILILERMQEEGIAPSPATHNILFSVLAASSKTSTSFRDVLDRNLQNERTLSVFLSHMTRTASFAELDRIVFHLLPELDLSDSLSDSSSSFSADLPPARPPPSTGRSPYLYTALLNALAKAGRVGLAERVFRNARWAAELSREPLEVESSLESSRTGVNKKPKIRSRRGWVLPQHAYTIMLQLYANEVKRGRQLERRDSRPPSDVEKAGIDSLFPSSPTSAGESGSTAFVRGWGRHALRVFLLRERRQRLEEQLGEAVSSSSTFPKPGGLRPSSRGTLVLPPFLRSEAAPIVAIWELEGGSRGPELESLQRAMKSDQARKALRTLFPRAKFPARGRGEGEGGEPARGLLSEWERASWGGGYRAPRDSGRERVRARAEVLRRRALEEKVKEEDGGEA